MTGASIHIADLNVARAGKRVLHSVSLKIKPAEITALVGRNGAGKSTLVLTVAGLIAPESGTILMGDAALVGMKPEVVRRSGVAVVLEGQPILAGLTVHDNLRAAGSMLPPTDLDAEVERVLTLLPELGQRLSVLGRSLSGGQKQMLAIGQALIGRPQFLLVDELSFGLAPMVVKRLATAIEAIAAAGVGVLLIEQFTTLALGMARDAYLLERGRVVFAGDSARLRERPELLHSAYLAADHGEADGHHADR